MTSDAEEINFFRFITTQIPLSLFENCILSPLYGKIPLRRLERILADSLKSSNTVGRKGHHVYVSMPFCAEDCSYCHCLHQRIRTKDVFARYEEYLKCQIASFASIFNGQQMISLYFGGGTPSLWPLESLERIFNKLTEEFLFIAAPSIHFEGHPASLDAKKIVFLKEHGVTRLTLGVQSLDDRVLRGIGRHQTAEVALRCLEALKKTSIPFVNVDLVAGLPGQTVASFVKGLREIIAMAPEGIHVNPLSQVLSSRCYRKESFDFVSLVKRRQEMVTAAKAILEESGYWREGFEAYQRIAGADNRQQTDILEDIHNVLGLGPNAQSVFPGATVFRDVGMGLRKPFYYGCEVDLRYSAANFLTLHLLKGVTRSKFKACFGEEIEEMFGREILLLMNNGILKQANGKLFYSGKWTAEGLFEYFSWTKVLLGSELLRALHKKYAVDYDRKREYTFQKDGVMAKMDDAFFLLTLYEVGY